MPTGSAKRNKVPSLKVMRDGASITCSGGGIVTPFKEPDEHSCNDALRKASGTSGFCTCTSFGTCTLDVELDFGHVTLSGSSTGLKGELRMLGFHTPGSPGTIPGPTLRVRAGDTLRVLLKNNLMKELVDTSAVPENNYRQFDAVNLHTHGLHISPLAPGDEVVNTKVDANQTNQYIYNIPTDHMGGTHWCK